MKSINSHTNELLETAVALPNYLEHLGNFGARVRTQHNNRIPYRNLVLCIVKLWIPYENSGLGSEYRVVPG